MMRCNRIGALQPAHIPTLLHTNSLFPPPVSQKQTPLPNKRCTTTIVPRAAAATAASQAVRGLWPVLVQAYHSDPVGAIIGVAVSIAAVALSAFLVASIPTLLALRRSAHAAEALLHTLREELPDTAAALRLSGLEMADAVSEVTALGTDLTEGLRASARAIVGAEQGVRQSIDMAGKAVTQYAVPTVKKALPGTKKQVEEALKQRSKLNTVLPADISETAGATKKVAQRLRTALGATALANTAVQYVNDRKRQQQLDRIKYSTEA